MFRLADSTRTRAFGATIQPIRPKRGGNDFKLVGSVFYLFEYSFDRIPISVGDVLKSEVAMVERRLEPRCAVDEKHGIGDVVFLAEFMKKPLGERGRTRRMQPDVQEVVRVRIDRRHQPIPSVV